MVQGILAYGAVGVAGTLAHYATLIVLVQIYDVEPVAGSTAGAIVGAAINYWLNHRFTFRSTAPHSAALARFLAVAAVGVLINAAILYFAVHVIWMHYFPGQLAATGIAFFATYELNRRWTF
jgi:putative flippase GtrA